MKQLFMKEIKLAIFPMTYFFAILSALLLIPSYPYAVGVSYFIFAIQINFTTARANKDQEFTAMLPIPRSHIVLSKLFSVAYTEALQLLFAIPFALLSSLLLNKNGNPVGLDANLTFFGEILIAYSVFNVVFLPNYHKTGYKAGVPLLLAIGAYLLTILVIELLIMLVPALHNTLDGLDPKNMGYQAIVLIVGLLVYVGGLYLSYKESVKKYSNVNL